MMIYLILYLNFMKIGAFSVGGGLATVPFLQELVDKYGWISHAELIDIIAVAESTPGAIGANAATFMGYKTAGFWGGIVAVLGLVTPAVIIIAVIAHFFDKFIHNKKVQNAFYGIRPVAAGIIAAAGIEVAIVAFELDFAGGFSGGSVVKMAIALGIYWLIVRYKKHPIMYIAGGALLGILIF